MGLKAILDVFGRNLQADLAEKTAKQRCLAELDRAAQDTREKQIERMGRALERARRPQWTDEQFEIWWTKDPLFTVNVTNWGFFGPGTQKQHVLWEAEQCLNGLNS
jgi:UDP-galactopyranose mutase